MNKNALLVAMVASLAAVSAPSYAGYMCGTDSMTGYVAVSGFADQDPTTFSATLRDLNGNINCEVPKSGYYSVDVSGALGLDLDLNGSIDLGVSRTTPVKIFSGALDFTGITPGSYNFSFTPGTLGVADNHVVPFGFSVDYDGNTSAAVMAFINAMLGAPVFTNPDGAGTLEVEGFVGTDGATMTFTESNLTWAGFGNVLAAADSVLGAGSPNFADAAFVMRNVQVHIPEPTTLALLGMGLLGLGLSRRRAA